MAETVDRGQTKIDSTLDNAGVDHSADELLLSANSEQEPALSVVMPTLNEEAGVAECITRAKNAIEELGVPAEIVVSDSSTDRTPDIAQRMGAIVVEPDQGGYGYAYRYAFERTRGDYIVMGDADTTYDFEQIPRLLEPVREGSADVVMGSRLNGDIKDGAMPPLHQHIGNPLLTKFLNVFYDAGVSDAHSGFRVFSREAFAEMDLESDGMEFASEMVMEAGARELVIEEMPIVYHEREGEETLDSFKDGWRHVRFMLVNAPGYLFSVPGLAMGGVGILCMSLVLFGVQLGSLQFGVRTMIAGSLLTMVGFQVLTFGVFGAVASDPIRKPTDPVTRWLTDHLTLERGATLGLSVFGLSAAYVGFDIYRWLTVGYEVLPSIATHVFALTAVVVGVQTLFCSFFMSVVTSTSGN